jgi:hypothetical protein
VPARPLHGPAIFNSYEADATPLQTSTNSERDYSNASRPIDRNLHVGRRCIAFFGMDGAIESVGQ